MFQDIGLRRRKNVKNVYKTLVAKPQPQTAPMTAPGLQTVRPVTKSKKKLPPPPPPAIREITENDPLRSLAELKTILEADPLFSPLALDQKINKKISTSQLDEDMDMMIEYGSPPTPELKNALRSNQDLQLYSLYSEFNDNLWKDQVRGTDDPITNSIITRAAHRGHVNVVLWLIFMFYGLRENDYGIDPLKIANLLKTAHPQVLKKEIYKRFVLFVKMKNFKSLMFYFLLQKEAGRALLICLKAADFSTTQP